MMCKIRCNPMHPLYSTLPVPYVLVQVTHSTLGANGCRNTQYHRTIIPFSLFLWNKLASPVFDGVGLADFKEIIES